MKPRDSITEALRKARNKGSPALVPYITAGFPKRESFRQTLQTLAGVADVIEIGVPFSDPMADGETIQRSSRAALAQGVSLHWILDELAQFRNEKASGR